jgi:hypothetical protein
MKFSTTILALSASLTSALPSPQSTGSPLPPADTTYYYFHTNVLPDQGNKTKYDNLYMVAYHTGAGLSDATFESETLNTHRGWFNGTQLRWFEPTTASDVIFGVSWGSSTNYDLWFPASTLYHILNLLANQPSIGWNQWRLWNGRLRARQQHEPRHHSNNRDRRLDCLRLGSCRTATFQYSQLFA